MTKTIEKDRSLLFLVLFSCQIQRIAAQTGCSIFLDVEGVNVICVEYGFELVAHARYGNPGNCGADFFQAVVDETSGACRSSKSLRMFTTRMATRTVEAMRRRKGENTLWSQWFWLKRQLA